MVSLDIRGVVIVAAGNGRAEIEELEALGSVNADVANSQVAVRKANPL